MPRPLSLRPKVSPGSIQPYSVSGVLAGAPANTIREGCQIHDVANEGAFLKDEVIHWKNRHNRFRVLRMNPMCRKQDSGSGSAILRL